MVLQNHGYDNPQIEVISESPRLEMLQNRLRQSGMRPVRATFPINASLADPVLLDISIATEPQILNFASDWASLNCERLLIVLGPVSAHLSAFNTLQLRDVDQLPTLRARIAIRQREIRRQREFRLRASTAERMGMEAPQLQVADGLRVLYLGEGSLSFMPLKSALKDSSIETVAALSQFTAQDHLASGQFHAVILHPQSIDDEATQFLTRFDPNDHAGALKLFVIEQTSFSKSLPVQYTAKATALLDHDKGAENIAAEITKYLNHASDIASSAPTPLARSSMELFSRPFLESHLATQFDESDATGEPFSLVSVRVRDGAQSVKLMSPIIAALLRDTDMAAKLDQDHICITLPATPYRGAIRLARRVEAAVGEQVEWRVIERRQFHTVDTLLGALVAKPTLQSLKRA